jgi:hypothetical protein
MRASLKRKSDEDTAKAPFCPMACRGFHTAAPSVPARLLVGCRLLLSSFRFAIPYQNDHHSIIPYEKILSGRTFKLA